MTQFRAYLYDPDVAGLLLWSLESDDLGEIANAAVAAGHDPARVGITERQGGLPVNTSTLESYLMRRTERTCEYAL